MAGEELGGGFRCQYRCRHRQDLLPCAVEVLGANATGGGRGNTGTISGDLRGSGSSGGGGWEDARRGAPLEPAPRSVLSVRFDEPAKAIAPGQVVALYKDGVCLGGGPIFRAEDHCAPVLVRTPPTVSKPPAKTPASTKRRRPRPRPTDRSASQPFARA